MFNVLENAWLRCHWAAVSKERAPAPALPSIPYCLFPTSPATRCAFNHTFQLKTPVLFQFHKFAVRRNVPLFRQKTTVTADNGGCSDQALPWILDLKHAITDFRCHSTTGWNGIQRNNFRIKGKLFRARLWMSVADLTFLAGSVVTRMSAIYLRTPHTYRYGAGSHSCRQTGNGIYCVGVEVEVSTHWHRENAPRRSKIGLLWSWHVFAISSRLMEQSHRRHIWSQPAKIGSWLCLDVYGLSR